MSDEELIRCFEADAIPAESFHHADHVRLAFAYLCRYPVLQALEKFCIALKSFAVARGKPDRYHETITHAYFFLIRERMARSEGAGWEEFAGQNADLLQWKDGILNRYYQDATLKSDSRATCFCSPTTSGDVGCQFGEAVRLPRPYRTCPGRAPVCFP